jgi:hypothetical protein
VAAIGSADSDSVQGQPLKQVLRRHQVDGAMRTSKAEGSGEIGRPPKHTEEAIFAFLDQRYRATGEMPSLTEIHGHFSGGGKSRVVRLRREWSALRGPDAPAKQDLESKVLASLRRDLGALREELAAMRTGMAELRGKVEKLGPTPGRAPEPPWVPAARALAELVDTRLAATEQIQTLLLLFLGRTLEREYAGVRVPATPGAENQTKPRRRRQQ